MAEVTAKLDRTARGRAYCYVVMSYDHGEMLFGLLRPLVERVGGLECIRHVDLADPAVELRQSMHEAIDGARLVVGILDGAEESELVLYELGYAKGKGKEVWLLAPNEYKIPASLDGLFVIRYANSIGGTPALEKQLTKFLTEFFRRQSPLWSMLIPREPAPSFILASPSGIPSFSSANSRSSA
ncbi:MAG: hypothetical protein HY744_14530 [Deltaproteobacteria bacterium]|nr:hypothetical protein [Deltaproteobacteria bacterium]